MASLHKFFIQAYHYKYAMVSAIIPAWNEDGRVANVVRALRGTPGVGEVIVVDDGSTDATGARAREAGAMVIRNERNMGKAEAMARGVTAAKHDIFLFIDADIAGLTPLLLTEIFQPVLSGDRDMFIGIASRKQFWLNRILHFFPLISGQRAVRRSLWNSIPQEYKRGFQIEIALNYFSHQSPRGSAFRLLRGLRHVSKEAKYGFLRGFKSRLKMASDIAMVACRLYVIRSLVQGAHRRAKPVYPE